MRRRSGGQGSHRQAEGVVGTLDARDAAAAGVATGKPAEVHPGAVVAAIEAAAARGTGDRRALSVADRAAGGRVRRMNHQGLPLVQAGFADREAEQ